MQWCHGGTLRTLLSALSSTPCRHSVSSSVIENIHISYLRSRTWKLFLKCPTDLSTTSARSTKRSYSISQGYNRTPWRYIHCWWRQHNPLRRRYISSRIHSVTCHKSAVFIIFSFLGWLIDYKKRNVEKDNDMGIKRGKTRGKGESMKDERTERNNVWKKE